MPDASRHDGYMLRISGVIEAMQAVSHRLQKDYCLNADSAYPISAWVIPLHKGNLNAAETAFNASMSSLARIQSEWGFGKLVAQWPYLDYKKNMKQLLMPCSDLLKVASILSNMHCCLYGSIISSKTGSDPPCLEDYMKLGSDL